MDDLDAVAFRLAVGRVGRRLRRLYIESTDGTELMLGELGVLNQLRQHGATGPGDLAVSERVSSQAISITLRGLEQKGLIKRSSADGDRRRVVVELTSKGLDALMVRDEAVTDALRAAANRALSASERKAIQKMTNILEKIAVEL